jgi:hypothetical protein
MTAITREVICLPTVNAVLRNCCPRSAGARVVARDGASHRIMIAINFQVLSRIPA